MATILCLETATTNCSVALSVHGSVVALKEDKSPGYSHAEKLHVFIAEVMEDANLKVTDLDAVAVSKGPGSYTGLRIGVSAAKGLCFAQGIPLISVATLEVLARRANEGDDFIIPMIDARRMEVYSAVFDKDKVQVRATKAEILNESSFDEYLAAGKVIFIGDGALKCKEIITHSNAGFMENELPSASYMASLADAKYRKSDTEDVAYFEPFYLKDFISG